MDRLIISGPEVLEARIAPAVFHWINSSGGNWNDANNWYNETTGTAGDGFPNSPDDDAKFEDVLFAKSAITIPNGVTITVHSILFDDDAGYKIVEDGTGKLRLAENGLITVAAESTGDHGIFAPIELMSDVTITNHSSTSLTIFGAISASGSGVDVFKTGTGTVLFTGNADNSYTGTTYVREGTLELQKNGRVAVPGPLVIGDPQADYVSRRPASVRLLSGDQIAEHEVTLDYPSTLDLNGFDDAIGNVVLHSGPTAGSTITTGAGTLTLKELSVNVASTGSVGASITGNLSIGASERDFRVADGLASTDLTVTGTITGSGTAKLGKEGGGTLRVNGNVSVPEGMLVYRGSFVLNGTSTPVALWVQYWPSFVVSGNVEELVASTGHVMPGELNTGNLALGGSNTLHLNVGWNGWEITHDQINVTGSVSLGGTLVLSVDDRAANGSLFTLIANDGEDPVNGTFQGLPEGTVIRQGDAFFQISYTGGDGNDVTLESLLPEVKISATGKTATFTDVDGDLVTIKTTRGSFQESDFKFIPGANDFGGLQLTLIDLSDDEGEFTNANLTITAKRGPSGGNGFVNVGYINATGVDLGKVSIAGDLGRIDAGDGNRLGIKSLTVGSLAQLGTATQEPNGGVTSIISGSLGTLVVKGDIRGTLHTIGSAEGSGALGSVTLGGSLVGGTIRADQDIGKIAIRGSVIGAFTENSGAIVSLSGDIGPVSIKGSLVGSRGDFSGSIRAEAGSIKSVSIAGSVSTDHAWDIFYGTPEGDGSIMAGAALGPVTIGGDVAGNAVNPVVISAGGSVKGAVKGIDLAIKSVSVGGRLEWGRILAGYDTTGVGVNADASIGKIRIGGDWLSSTMLAGVHAGADNFEGTGDDAKLSGLEVRDSDKAVSQIAAVLIKGQAFGNCGSFGIVAEQIKSARIGDVRLPLNPLVRHADDFFAMVPNAPTVNFTLMEVTQ